MPKHLRFTVENLDGLKATGTLELFSDPQVPNLELRQSAKGALRFYFRGRFDNKVQRIPLGPYPETKPKMAIALAEAARLAIRNNRDPRKAISAGPRRKGGDTLREFFQVYLDDHAKANRKNWKDAERDFKNHFDPLADYSMDQINADMVTAWHKKIGKSKGEPVGNKQINLLRAIYSKAMRWKKPDGRPYATLNPASAEDVPRFQEEGRDRFIQASEIPAFFQALEGATNPDIKHFFKLALFTGQRKTNLMQMSFEDIDLDNRVWTIPRDQFKGGKGKRHPHPVPLVDQAVFILTVRREMFGRGWVFPGHKRGTHVKNANYWWNLVRKEARLDDVVIHDIRRTIASWMAMTGASYPIIAQLLGHTLPGATQIYARLALDPVRDAVQTAVHAMETLTEGGE